MMGVLAALLLVAYMDMGFEKVHVIEPTFRGACVLMGGEWVNKGLPGAACEGINWKEVRDERDDKAEVIPQV